MYYKFIPKSNPDRYDIVNTLWHTKTYYFKVCGYCENKGKYLTVKQLKNKGCLGKQCKYLVKIDHPLWTHRDNIKAKRKEQSDVSK